MGKTGQVIGDGELRVASGWLRAGAAGTLAVAGLLLAGCEMPQQESQTRPPRLAETPRVEIPPPPPPTNVRVNPALRASARRELDAALASPDPVIRAHAIEAIKESLGSAGRSQILQAFSDTDPIVRFAAAMAAGELRLEQARPLLPALLDDTRNAQQQPDPHVQIAAIFALHRLGDTRYSAGLEQALRSPESDVRANAAFALGRLGERSALRILRPVLRDRAVEVRIQVAEAMWRLDDEEGLKYLVAAGLSGHPAQQMVGLLALAGPRDPQVIAHLRPGLESDYVEVALVAGRGLGMLGSDEAYMLAIKATKSGEMRQRFLAALALGAIGRADAQDVLAPLLKDADPDVRVAAAAAILQLR